MIIPGESLSVADPDSDQTHALSVPTDQLSRALLPVSRHLVGVQFDCEGVSLLISRSEHSRILLHYRKGRLKFSGEP
ncbi:hypothetical protein BS47DRAFT_749607 [Hydnum rufescens UP504]|uniref:Uncharacterized protein n=1 Tax=Hydnum rufescens UP504 TaxID=1448309 RepID=A0A9P6BA78_9AGAM|nr:hypothetical protein BS47DRAFT_749607 [Hydnum rufescens UP504]